MPKEIRKKKMGVERLPKASTTLSKEEKEDLLSPIKPLNFRVAKREHTVGYLYLLNRKINALRNISRLGNDIDEVALKFSAEMVYKTLVDMQGLLNEYMQLKDELLYNNYAIETEKCKNCVHLDQFTSLCVDCVEEANMKYDKV